MKQNDFEFGTQLGVKSSLPIKLLRPKLAGVLARGHTKIWDPYLFLQWLKLASEKNGIQHEFRFTLPNTTFRTKIGRV